MRIAGRPRRLYGVWYLCWDRFLDGAVGAPQTNGNAMKQEHISWIVVADGRRCRISASVGPGAPLTTVQEFSQPGLASRDIDADKPGRSFDSAGQGRHGMEPSTDANRTAEKNLAREIALFVGENRKQGAFERLFLVAAPRTLGDLRAMLPKEASCLIAGEIDKDLTNISVHDLPGHLETLLAN